MIYREFIESSVFFHYLLTFFKISRFLTSRNLRAVGSHENPIVFGQNYWKMAFNLPVQVKKNSLKSVQEPHRLQLSSEIGVQLVHACRL